jgi:phage tail tube protein FII
MAGNTAIIPEIVRNCRCYYDNKPKNFTGNLTLPVLSRMTVDISGAGIAGTVSVPVRGNLEAMQATYATRVANPDFFATFSAGRHTLEFRGVIQASNATQAVDMNFACFMGVLARSVTPGAFTKAGEMGATAEFEVLDCTIIIDGVVYANISKLNDIIEIRDTSGVLIDENAEARKFLS